MKLSGENKQLVLKNRRLVHYLVQKLGVTANSVDYDDIVSVGTIGLIKAAITFDESKKYTFATYAAKCIQNEIFRYFRKTRKYANDISIDEPLGENEEGKQITWEDKLEHPQSNFTEKIVNIEEFIQLISIILNCLKPKNRLVMLYRIANLTQESVSKILNVSRAYVSKLEINSIAKIKEIANKQEKYKEVFAMSIIGEKYNIIVESKDIKAFNKKNALLLKSLISVEDLPDFKVSCNKERIVIEVPAHPESFAFIAKIVQKLDDFSMTFSADKNENVAKSSSVGTRENKT